jgi:hypothetical protein
VSVSGERPYSIRLPQVIAPDPEITGPYATERDADVLLRSLSCVRWDRISQNANLGPLAARTTRRGFIWQRMSLPATPRGRNRLPGGRRLRNVRHDYLRRGHRGLFTSGLSHGV